MTKKTKRNEPKASALPQVYKGPSVEVFAYSEKQAIELLNKVHESGRVPRNVLTYSYPVKKGRAWQGHRKAFARITPPLPRLKY